MRLRRISGDKGTTAVEFALILPLFLVLILGIVDLGMYFYVQHTLQFATREGTRLGLVGTTLKDGGGHSMSREQSIITTIQNFASLAVSPSGLSIYIYPLGDNYVEPKNWKDLQPDAGGGGDYMRVRTRYTYQFILSPLLALLPGDQFFTQGTATIESVATYRNEMFGT